MDGAGLVVIDTNIALDLLLFQDPAASPLRAALEAGRLRWIASPPMAAEFERVLAYPALARQLQARGHSAAALVQAFHRMHATVAEAPRASVRCTDPDDQVFVDLAVAHRALLLSKDHAVLRLRRRLAALGVQTAAALEPVGGQVP